MSKNLYFSKFYEQTEVCKLADCPIDGGWGRWEEWGRWDDDDDDNDDDDEADDDDDDFDNDNENAGASKIVSTTRPRQSQPRLSEQEGGFLSSSIFS